MIALTLGSPTLEEDRQAVMRAGSDIDLCELRVDLLQPKEQKKAHTFTSMVDIPVILTVRRIEDGGRYAQSERTRKDLLSRLLEAGNFAYVDIEGDVKKSEAEEIARRKGVRIIRSFHDFEKVPEDIYSRIYSLHERGDIAKVAVTPRSFQDVVTLFRIEAELRGVEKIVIGMGPYGVCTRILYRKLGSLLTFASESEIAPGQLTASMLKHTYRADTVDDRTVIYGIIGNPVHHSLSPVMHNRGFHAINYNAIYVPFLVDQLRSFLMFAEMMKIRGFSVTVPFKQEVLSYLGNVTREVKQIGSCNTVVRVPGMWKGINTDYYGFIKPIMKDLESGKIRNALVIGAGGASHAIVWALRNYGVKVTILNRTLSHAERLARLNLCSVDTLENAGPYTGKADLVVQTTPVGLWPDTEKDPVPELGFTGRETVYDIIYRPRMTKFLERAGRAGCTLHFGSEMLIEQGKLQFESFSGYHYPKWVDTGLDEADGDENDPV